MLTTAKQNNWINLVALFEKVSNFPIEQRQAIIAEENLDEQTLDRLERMLDTLDRTVSLLDTPVINKVQYTKDWFKEHWENTQLGQYKLDTLLHEGNNAAVFLASQKTTIERQVVIKLLKSETSDQLKEFFRFEQQTLAKLSHPNIASIYTVGINEDNIPYMVMEYVDGQELLAYCNSRQLTVQQRLELLLEICESITYSHQNGVLHRDLKSSNILVRDFNGKPTPTVIDFGIASDLNNNLVKAEDILMGTPEYMSPEHVFDLNNMDVRADVYSLGMILFTLLIGSIPFKRSDLLKMDTAERLKYIAEFEAPLPSQHYLSMDTDQQTLLAAARSTRYKSFKRALSPELDSIYRKATQKNRELRYSNVSKFTEDIKNYLKGYRVKAYSNTPTYRLKKFIKRNKIATVVSFVMVLMTCTFLFNILKQNRIIESESAKALDEKNNAEQISQIILNSINFNNPRNTSNLGNNTTQAILDEAYINITNTKSLSDNTRAKLLIALANSYYKNRNYEKAKSISDTMFESLVISNHEVVCEKLIISAKLHKQLLELKQAYETTEDAIEYCSKDTKLISYAIDAHLIKAEHYSSSNQFEISNAVFEDILKLHNDYKIQDNQLLADIYEKYAYSLITQGNIDQGNTFFDKAEELIGLDYTPDHARMVNINELQLRVACYIADEKCNPENINALIARASPIWGKDSPVIENLKLSLTNYYTSEHNWSKVVDLFHSLIQSTKNRGAQYTYDYFFYKSGLLIQLLNLRKYQESLILAQEINKELEYSKSIDKQLLIATKLKFDRLFAHSLATNLRHQEALGKLNAIIDYHKTHNSTQQAVFLDALSLRAMLHLVQNNITSAIADANELIQYSKEITGPSYLLNKVQRYKALELYIELQVSWSQDISKKLKKHWYEYLSNPARTEENIYPYTLISDYIEQEVTQ